MEYEKPAKIIDEQTARKKAEYFCAYQERSQQEVRDKLYELGMHSNVVENIISNLINDNFINEERFAKAYARGKFNQKGWGRIKIKQGLKFKKVPDVLMKKALAEINYDDYLIKLKNIIDKKAAVLVEKNTYKRNYKLQQYALSRGYEADIISDVLNNSDL